MPQTNDINNSEKAHKRISDLEAQLSAMREALEKAKTALFIVECENFCEPQDGLEGYKQRSIEMEKHATRHRLAAEQALSTPSDKRELHVHPSVENMTVTEKVLKDYPVSDKRDDWISVDDRLPENNQRHPVISVSVLVQTSSGHAITFWDTRYDDWDDVTAYGSKLWQPLSLRPKLDGEGL